MKIGVELEFFICHKSDETFYMPDIISRYLKYNSGFISMQKDSNGICIKAKNELGVTISFEFTYSIIEFSIDPQYDILSLHSIINTAIYDFSLFIDHYELMLISHGIAPFNIQFKYVNNPYYKLIREFHGNDNIAKICSSQSSNGYDLTKLDCLYYMNADEQSEHQLEILNALSISGVKLINPYNSHINARDKFVSNFILRKNNISVPRASLIPYKDNDKIKVIFDLFKTVILKPRNRHGGKGIQKFTSYETFKDFQEFVNGYVDNFYFEEFIDFGDHDYRIEIFNGNVIGTYAREKTHTFKTNISSGGIMRPCSVSNEQISLAQKAVESLKITTSIVDIVTDRNKRNYILEVNPIMGIFVEAGMKYSDKSIIKNPDLSYSNDELKLNVLVNYIKQIIE